MDFEQDGLKPDGQFQPEEEARYFCNLLFRGILTESGEPNTGRSASEGC
jgi:hypothetical protein